MVFVSMLASHPPPGSVDIRKYMRRGVCVCVCVSTGGGKGGRLGKWLS